MCHNPKQGTLGDRKNTIYGNGELSTVKKASLFCSHLRRIMTIIPHPLKQPNCYRYLSFLSLYLSPLFVASRGFAYPTKEERWDSKLKMYCGSGFRGSGSRRKRRTNKTRKK
jgi:hypothetical protein